MVGITMTLMISLQMWNFQVFLDFFFLALKFPAISFLSYILHILD